MLTSPNGKTYIGQTIRPIQERLKEHETGKSKRCRGIYNAIQYHGWDKFEKDWYECPDEDLNNHEELMVEVLGTLSPNGYNLREGGGSRGKLSEETKEKLSGENHHNYGKPQSKETKQKQREAKLGEKNYWYGKTPSEEHKQKLREANSGKNHPMYGKTQSEEVKQKNKEANSGKNNPMYGKTGDKHNRSKRVYQYDLDGIFINSFGSTEEAAQYIKGDGASGTHIRACARGVKKYKTAYKFKWSYELTIFL